MFVNDASLAGCCGLVLVVDFKLLVTGPTQCSTRVQMLVQPTTCFSEVVFCEIFSDATILKSGLLAFYEQESKKVLRVNLGRRHVT